MATDTSVGVDSPGRAPNLKPNLRTDNWRKSPILTFIGLTAFVLYATIRVATQSAYFAEGANYSYLTPFASPCVSANCVKGSSHFGQWFGEFPAMVPLAIVTLTFILLFRLTCF